MSLNQLGFFISCPSFPFDVWAQMMVPSLREIFGSGVSIAVPEPHILQLQHNYKGTQSMLRTTAHLSALLAYPSLVITLVKCFIECLSNRCPTSLPKPSDQPANKQVRHTVMRPIIASPHHARQKHLQDIAKAGFALHPGLAHQESHVRQPMRDC